MRRILLAGLLGVALAIPASAEAAVTLDPDTELTVVCPKHAFVGTPFTRDDTGEPVPFQVHYGRTRWFVVPTSAPAFSPAKVKVERIRLKRAHRTFRLEADGVTPIRWRGC